MSEFIVTYNNPSPGAQIEILGDQPIPYLVRFNNVLGGKKLHIWGNEIRPNHWSRLSRGFFTNWHIEVWAWDKGLHLVWEEYYKLAGKQVYIEITPESNLQETVEYLKAIIEFSEVNGCISLVNTPIQTAEILNFNSPNVRIISSDAEKAKCYAYYIVGKNLEDNKYPTDTIETEKVIWDVNHIRDYRKLNLTPYEIAKDILFGLSPDHPSYAKEYVKLTGEKFFNLQYQ